MSVNFEKYKAEANDYLYTVMDELCVRDRDQAGRIFRAILQTLRDRMPVNEAVNFAQQLPIIWKGVFYDDYQPDQVPFKTKNVSDFVFMIRSKDAFAFDYDFPTEMHPISAFNCVLRALHKRMSEGTVEKVLNLMPKELQESVYVPEIVTHLEEFQTAH